MTSLPSINPRIVETLYVEALVLADAARSRFDELRENASVGEAVAEPPISDFYCIDLTCEALRTSTRVMHCLAWLLNHRAWFAGQLNASQLRRHGRLITHFPASDAAIVGRLPDDLAALVHESERLYARIQRLDQAWRNEIPPVPGAIERLRDRLAHAAQKQA